MTQREFNRLMSFQPNVEPFESLRDLVQAWFENELGGDIAEERADAYLEAIRATFVTESG